MLTAQKYSLLIPTFNRSELLDRFLGYLAAKRVSFPVFILDSSNDDNQRRNRAIVHRYGLDARLIQFDTSVRFEVKIRSALEELKSNYVSICADDDVVFIDALEECIKELDADDKLVASHGVYLNFLPSEKEIKVDIEYASPPIDANDPIGRVCQLLSRYEALNYAVFRRDMMMEILDAVSSLPQNLFWELFSNLVPVIKGKVKRLNCVYYARLAHGPSMGHPATSIATDPDLFFKEFLEYRERLFTYCKIKVPQFGAEAAKTLTQAHVIYFCRALQDGSAIRHALAGTSSPLGNTAFHPGLESVDGPMKRPLILSLSPVMSLARNLRLRVMGADIVNFRSPRDNALTFSAPRNVRALLSSKVITDLSRFRRA